MGADCKIVINRPAQMDDIAEVAAVLLGHPHELYKIKGSTSDFHRASGYAFHASSSGLNTRVCNMGSLRFNDKSPQKSLFYLLEYKDGVYLSARSYPEAIALGKALVDFFGGYVIPNDYEGDGEEQRYTKASPTWDTSPEDGEDYSSFQRRKYEVQPLTEADFIAAEGLAAYPRDD